MRLDGEEFRLEEYRGLREEVRWLLKDYRELERNVALACGLLLAWLFSFAQQRPPGGWIPTDLAWFIPFLLSVAGAVRAKGVYEAFNVYHGYLIQIEDSFYEDLSLRGWEHYLDEGPIRQRDKHKKRRAIGSSRFAFIFWVALMIVTLIIGALFGCHLIKWDAHATSGPRITVEL